MPGSDLLHRQRIATRAEGETVVLSVGNADLRLDYPTALVLSQWLRVSAKEAKRTAGDMSRHWSVIGTISGG